MDVIPDLRDTVAVEPGKRASRVVLTTADARIVVFAFDAGAELAEHSAPGPILVQALEGILRFTAEGETVELHAGGVIHLDARTLHSVRAVEPSKMSLTLLPASRD